VLNITRNIVFHFTENPGIENNSFRNYDVSRYLKQSLETIKSTFQNKDSINDEFLLSSLLLAFKIPSPEWTFTASYCLGQNYDPNLLIACLDQSSPPLDNSVKVRALREIVSNPSLPLKHTQQLNNALKTHQAEAIQEQADQLCQLVRSHFQGARYQRYTGELRTIEKATFKQTLLDFKEAIDRQLDRWSSELEQHYFTTITSERILILALRSLHASTHEWQFLAEFALNKVGSLSFLMNLFESTAGLTAQNKLKILSKLERVHTHRDFLTSYGIHMMTRDQLSHKELLQVMPLLQFNGLSANEWLSVIDAVLTPPDCAPHLQDNSPEMIATYLEAIRMETLLRQDMERFEGQRTPRGQKQHLSSLKRQITGFQYYSKACEALYPILNTTEKSPLTERAILVHLKTHYPNHSPTKNISTPCSKPTITFVASQENTGEGADKPETLDYFRGNPYPSLSLVVPELKSRGYPVEVLSWEDPTIDWSRKFCLFINHVWGYTQKPDPFYEWLEKIKSQNIPLVNAMDFLEWNIHKTYLRDLQEAGIPVIPTLIIPEQSMLTLEDILQQSHDLWRTTDIIAKGVVDAGGGGYKHYHPGQETDMAHHIEMTKSKNRGAVIQPYWPEISQKGELSFVFEGGVLSHSYLKVPALGSDLVQLLHQGRSYPISKADLSSNSEEFFKKLHEFRPDLTLTLSELIIAHGQIHGLFHALKIFFAQKHLSEPPIIRIDCALRHNRLYIMEVEGIHYLEMGDAMAHDPEKPVVKWYADEILRQLSIAAAYRNRTEQ
jgi:hypothetical protein